MALKGAFCEGDRLLLHRRRWVAVLVDFGEILLQEGRDASDFRFLEHLPDDPYGPMVDRCARIAKYARAGTVICTGEYRKQLGTLAAYVSMCSVALRGFRNPEELFARWLVEADSEEYLKPFISVVNEEGARVQGYRFVGRKLSTEFVREFGGGRVRPFLVRELLNIPKLPYSPREFADVMRGAVNVEEKEHEFIGHFVEWEGTFESFTRDSSEISLTLEVATPSITNHYFHILLILPHSNLEIVNALRKGQHLRARGVIHDIRFHIITLNYVDLEIVAESAGA